MFLVGWKMLRDAWRTVVKKATELNDKFIISKENQRIILVTMSSICPYLMVYSPRFMFIQILFGIIGKTLSQLNQKFLTECSVP